MQFQVPQYIDVEDKIVGPLTLKQFFYIATGFLTIFVTFFILTTWLWLITSVIIGSASLAFALVKYNGRPLMTVAIAALRYYTGGQSYTWQKDAGTAPAPKGFLAKLGLHLTAGTKPVAGRETSVNGFFSRSLPAQDRAEIIRSVGGDRNVAKRIDYR
ncbi:MAG: PrgI family protein [Candidatus Pacebacteria bacterium]|nr:PrgI family protein [Candidatus Paceibacterota bacterium]